MLFASRTGSSHRSLFCDSFFTSSKKMNKKKKKIPDQSLYKTTEVNIYDADGISTCTICGRHDASDNSRFARGKGLTMAPSVSL